MTGARSAPGIKYPALISDSVLTSNMRSGMFYLWPGFLFK
uniref:Uncharacterized protein n=1 Tax=Klebsiella pneumoniae TaxID=573 RepID=A0A168QDV9_KLEPN|nr:hypothetical protein [Klebsiella pneumoniae]